MAVTPWLLLICLAATAATAGVLQARAQPDSNGFISIDCGLPGTASYVDMATNLSYVPDAGFTDSGSNHDVSAVYSAASSKGFHTVRSFPVGARNCYTLRRLVAGLKYLVRAEFMYGNYDGLDRLPVFDLYIGVNFWTMVNLSSPESEVGMAAIVVVPDDFVQVCMVNTGSGTPFISVLELRPLKNSLYPLANATKGLSVLSRINFGPETDGVIRYPDDPYDRVWSPWMIDANAYAVISTTSKVVNIDNDIFEVPSKVMQTAITPRNGTKNIEFNWDSEPQPKYPKPDYIAVMYFSELQFLPKNAVREFYININGDLFYPDGVTPDYLHINAVYSIVPLPSSARYNVSINATANSTLPPFINAIEVFSVMSTADYGTDSQDVSAMMAIKAKYRVQKNWDGDPCGPKILVWDGLACSYAISGPPKITGVNVSFSGLVGDISSFFANLKAVQSLNLSYNNLTGTIPDGISQLPSLTVLDLTSNQLNGSIPSGLLKRAQDGSLILRYGNNPDLCTNPDSCPSPSPSPIKKEKSKLAIYIAVPVVVVVGLTTTLFFCFLGRKKQGSRTNTVRSHVPPGDVHSQSSLQLENRRFTYNELQVITNNFEHVLGQGGFGKVYSGFLEDGTQVAVKIRSQTSNQGVKEFLAEAQILARIHHKNLVSMIGYSRDGPHMALVYEYMSQGTLREQIAGNSSSYRRCLTWRRRLRIALESAQGLEYLHKGCNPPLIHRDVKASNILLNEKIEAKIADFGLSKAFSHDNSTLSTSSLFVVVGTPGYVDPEYHATGKPTTKSDVYSFGVVLLELVTGRPAILHDPEPTNIIDWARRRLARGDIEGVVDARMDGDYDINSAWKVTEIALKCTSQASVQRPTMTEVAAQLQECLVLEEGSGGATGTSREPNSGHSTDAANGQSMDTSQSSTAFEMEQIFRRMLRMDTGPVTR